MTASEIREKILATVATNGGHLAASLGAVELSIALAESFDPYKDRIIWDVGHQAYAWKILTGRAESFGTLRTFGGLSGFPTPLESQADAAVAGHAGAALSVAEGYAAARDRKGTDEHIVAIIGDASIVNGMSLEALNFCQTATNKVIVVLNDNGMGISRPIGSIARFLGRMLSGVRYNRLKAAVERTGHTLKLTFLRKFYHRLESRIKSIFLSNSLFETFGLRYIGPIDGHNIAALKQAFIVAKEDKRSVILHVITTKGKGYPPAEKDPTSWHGVAPFDRALGQLRPSTARTWSTAFGGILTKLAEKDDRIVALTAAMKDGTGLCEFAQRFPTRFFDVGIAEEHMVGFAAGLAAGGLRPVVAIYSTFLQRAIDQVMHDVAIASLPVIFCIDRAGIVGADGMTHQGVFDIALLRALPNLTIVQPKDEADFEFLLKEALERKGPTAIRYPRGVIPAFREVAPAPASPKIALWVTGDYLEKANAIAQVRGDVEVVYARQIKPFDHARLALERQAGLKVVSLENGTIAGGLGEALGADIRFGWPDCFIPHGSVGELEAAYGLDVPSILKRLEEEI